MRAPDLKVQYYATYYYAGAVRNILHDEFAYIRHLDDFYGDGKHLGLIQPYRRDSAFHAFIEFVVEHNFRDLITDVDLERRQREYTRFEGLPVALVNMETAQMPLDSILHFHGARFPKFRHWLRERGKTFGEVTEEDLEEFHDEFFQNDLYYHLLEQFTDEAFFILFQNRQLLLMFNAMIARSVRETTFDLLDGDERELFARDGVLKRAHIPQWARSAVYFRDRGRCVTCRRDLTGVVTLSSSEHFDHIVPLASGGLNDVSNLQLLCDQCNLRKSAGEPATSAEYEAWYDKGGG